MTRQAGTILGTPAATAVGDSGMNLTCRQRSGYYEITMEGTVPTDIDELVRRVFAAVAASRARRVLVDFRSVAGSITTIRRLLFGLAMADQNYAHLVQGLPAPRFAFLGDEALVDPQPFGETVAVNRGVDIRVSTDPDEAMQYLIPDGAPDPQPPTANPPAPGAP